MKKTEAIMKPDAEGEYVERIIQRQEATPRPLPEGSLFRLYFSSPNSRYSIFVGFFFMGCVGLMFFFQSEQGRYANSTSSTIIIVAGVLLSLFAFAFPLVNARRIRRGIRLGLVTIGKVDGVQDARTTAYSTTEGMRNGAIRALVSYAVDGLPSTSRVFLDRPWVGDVERGTQLKLLVDPDKHNVLYVVGIVE